MYNNNQKLSWNHAALILAKNIPVGSPSANLKLKSMLLNIGDLEDIYQHFYGFLPIDTSIKAKLDKIYEKLNFDFHVITVNDNEYPENLKKLENAAPVLYCRGDITLLSEPKSIAFVGTRELNNPTHIEHGKHVVERLINSGCRTIVSGLAAGSDTLGHKSAIECGGKTIAVLGTPLDQYFPKENRQLQEEIAQNHLLVSEYPIGIRSFGSFFANRNRTTVGLSTEGVVVARAGDRSGTQYAIRHCVEQSKQLYALENNIYEPEYSWVNNYKHKLKIIRH